MSVVDCRFFNGYKPCTKNTRCDTSCTAKDIPSTSLLVVHLGALGAVVRSTSWLKALKRKYPKSMVTWVTEAPAHQLLKFHPAIDRVLTTSESDLLQLGAFEFECAFVVDKAAKAVGVLHHTRVEKIYGFKCHPVNGAIIPATAAAEELWELGLDNHQKFFVNKKPETQLMVEALELGPYKKEDYWLPLTAQEAQLCQSRYTDWIGKNGKKWILGLNTGCSSVIPYKKLTVEFHRQLIDRIFSVFDDVEIVLLGGPEDTERNIQIAQGKNVISSATQSGLRDGLVSVAACDVVVTGDSLGMHMAISQQKQVIAWFGPTCAQEIELYDRGFKILTKSPCSPCWKRTCEKSIMCYDQVSLEEIINALKSSRANCLFGRPIALHPVIEEVPGAVATTQTGISLS